MKKTEKIELTLENDIEGGEISLKYVKDESIQELDIWVKGDNTVTIPNATKDKIGNLIKGLTEIYEEIK